MRSTLTALLTCLGIASACSGPASEPAPTPDPVAAAGTGPARIVPTANPNSVPPDDRGAASNAAEALEVIRRVQGDPEALLAAYREGASRATTMDLTPLDIGPDSVIADIGAGTGALPVRLIAEGVPFGKLYAVETDRGSLDILGAALEGLPGGDRVESVLSQRDNVALPPATVDRVVVLDTGIGCIPSVGDPAMLPPMRRQSSARLLDSLREAVTDDARVHVLRPWNPPPVPPYRCPQEWVVQSFAQADFRLVQDHPQTPPEGKTPEHKAFHLVFAPGAGSD